MGDTRTTKSILDVLMAAPFGYTPLNERVSASHVRSSESDMKAKFTKGDVFFRVQADKFIKANQDTIGQYADGNSLVIASKPGKGKVTAIMSDKEN